MDRGVDMEHFCLARVKIALVRLRRKGILLGIEAA